MPKIDPRVDEYINNAAPFAQPILSHLRKLVHIACPQVEETIKWGFPVFEFKGPLCNMASFKAHVSFGFWKGNLLADPHSILEQTGKTAMGSLGKITSVEDLPDAQILVEYIKEAMRLNEENIKAPSTKKDKKELDIPQLLIDELSQNPKAEEVFNNFSYSHQKEYVEWINEAKTEPTKLKRVATTIEWLKEGKSKNWKYVKK